MKKLLVLLALVFNCAIFGQRIKFVYDDAGNQIRRFICLCSAKMASDTIFKTPETLTQEDMVKDVEYEQISYYPNPVREELYVRWKTKDGIFLSGIEVVSMSGQMLKSYPNLKNTDNASIGFKDFPEGIYNLILVYDNGERKTLKIVKN